MANTDTIAIKLQKLIDKINEVTNASDKNLIDAVDTLINKYQDTVMVIEAVAGELGSINNPIEYIGNISLEKDKYYLQDGNLYLCINSSTVKVYHPLDELLEYVSKV